MNENVSGNAASIGRSLTANAERVCKDCGVKERQNLMVERGETVVLAYDSSRFKAAFRQVKPQSIDEVRRLMGVDPAVAAKAGRSHDCGCSKGGRFLGEAELESEDQATRGKALSMARASARSFVMGGALATPSQKALLDRYIQVSATLINVIFLQDIEVQNGATLVISSSTHALYANKIRIHGTGRIVCHGPTTINCASVEGDYKKRVLVGPAININTNAIGRLEK